MKSTTRSPRSHVAIAVTVGLALTGVVGILTATHGVGNATSPSAAAPAAKGNNGTIKIDGVDFDSSPANHPHVGCTFTVSFWGFDAGDDHATVAFDVQAPSGKSGTYPNTQGSLDFHFTGSGPGSTLDHTETYTLDPTGFAVQPNQGYHAKVIASVTSSKGNMTKSKVFWFGPCVAPSPSPSVSPSVSPSTSASPSPSTSASPSPSVSPSTSASPSASVSATVSATASASISPSAGPSPTVSVAPTSVTRSPSASPSVKGSRHTRKPPQHLAFTGTSPLLPVGGGLLVLSGAVLLLLLRRRRTG